jgi:hypothetical protein
MRLMLVVLATTILVQAQAQPPEAPRPSPDAEEKARVNWLADQVKDAVEKGNFPAANLFVSQLGLAVTKREMSFKLEEFESQLPAAGPIRIYPLTNAAKAAYDASDYAKAEKYAREVLALAEEYPKDPQYGVAVFFGHMVLGRIALARDHNIKEAKAELLASGKTPGSATLNSFGPNPSLARDLLAIGERDVVLQFFGQCRSFWKIDIGRKKLDDWTKTAEGCCRMPNFAENLRY